MRKTVSIFKGMGLSILMGLIMGCMSTQDEPIRVSTNVWIGYEPLYLAQHLNYYDDVPISMVQMSSSTDVLRAFRNGMIDCATLTLDESFLLLQAGFDIKILFIMDISNGADVLLSRPEIKTMKDLKGKRVGVETSTVGAYTLSRALEQGHIKTNEIQIVPSFVEGHVEAYLSGKVDAVVTFEPARTRLIEAGAKELFSSKQIPNEILDVFVVSNEVYRKRTADFEKIKKAWYKTLDYLKLNPEDGIWFVSKRMGFTADEYKKSLMGIKLPSQEEANRIMSTSFFPTARRIVGIMLKEKLLNKQIDPSKMMINQ